jgi:Protein of unknown function (DUF1524)
MRDGSRSRRRLLLVASALVALAATGAGGASAHRDPCHSRHSCPSDHHTYVWRGLSCTSYVDERLRKDGKTVVVAGRRYWCHAAKNAAPGTTNDDAPATPPVANVPVAAGPPPITTKAAVRELSSLRMRLAQSMAGYSRDRFGPSWPDTDRNGCDTRDDILRRDLTRVRYRSGSRCVVGRGLLRDPYTGRRIVFVRGIRTSRAVQIDHVVALGDAWRTGAAAWPAARRLRYANDPLVLLAVDGPENQAKGDDDASEWLPPNRAYDCRYVKQQIQIKTKYRLSVTPAERSALRDTLNTCQ